MSSKIEQCIDCGKTEEETVLIKYPYTTRFKGSGEAVNHQKGGREAYSCLNCIQRRETMLSGAGKPGAVIKQIAQEQRTRSCL